MNQVFYVKDMSTKPKKGKTKDNGSDIEPKLYIVLSGKRNIVGIEDRSDMLEDCEKNDRIPPFIVNSCSSLIR